MRPVSINTLFIVIMAILITGCRKDHNTISESQKILFMYDFNSGEMDLKHYGYLIDNKGNVLTYFNPENWNYHDKYFVLTEKQISENVTKCELSDEKIPKEELQKYSNYIRNMASSKVSARRNAENGTGTAEFICFQYFENTGTYEGHLIKMEGNSTCENLNFYSKRVVAWMREIGNNTDTR